MFIPNPTRTPAPKAHPNPTSRTKDGVSRVRPGAAAAGRAGCPRSARTPGTADGYWISKRRTPSKIKFMAEVKGQRSEVRGQRSEVRASEYPSLYECTLKVGWKFEVARDGLTT